MPIRSLPVALLVFLVAAASAQAADRYASPNGSGSACTQAAPCALPQAVSGAQAGDTLLLAGGTYSGPMVTVDKSLAIQAQDPANRPAVVWDGSGNSAVGMDITAGTVSLSDIDVTGYSSGLGVESGAGAVTIARCRLTAPNFGLFVDGPMDGSGAPTTLSDSVVRGELYTKYRNVTAQRMTIVTTGSTAMRVFGGNAIAIDESIVQSSSFAVGTSGGSGTIAVRHSYVSNTTGVNDSTGDIVGSSPGFRDAQAADFHLTPGSPAIGAGDPNAPAAPDLDGYPRSTPIDLGAYAFRVPSIPQPPNVSGGSATGATVSAVVRSAGDRGTAKVDVTGPNGFTLSRQVPLSVTSQPQTVAFALNGLTPNTTYSATVSVDTLGGAATAAPVQLTTLPLPPAALTGAATGIDQTVAAIAGSVDTQGVAGTAHLDWGAGSTLDHHTPDQAIPGGAPATVSAALTGLTPSTTYSYRVVATNAGGTTIGDTRTFTTAATPPPPIPLACAGKDIVILDVHRAGRRTAVSGLALAKYAGQTVTVVSNQRSGKGATAVVGPDGRFSTTVAGYDARARFTARVAGKASAALKASRKLAIVRVSGTKVTFRAIGVKRGVRVAIVRETSCTAATAVKMARVGRGGRFTVTLARPVAPDTLAFYRATLQGAKFKSYTLPVVVGA